MKNYKQYKAEFDRDCPGAYSNNEIEQMYFDDIIVTGLKQGNKPSKEFIRENVSREFIWWINKHFYYDNQIV